MNAIISVCHFCELHGPQVLFCTQPNHPQEGPPEQDGRVKSPPVQPPSEPSTPTGPSGYKNDHCEGCYSVKPGYISNDEDVKVSYISSRQPHNREVFSMIRQACLRSLSGEVCPGTEGPIFFGNDQQGHVLSYTFHIKDSQARGFLRRFSIIIIMMDKIYLLNSWPFLVSNLKTIVEHLQTKARKVYDCEQIKCPQRSQRLPSTSITPGNFLQQRGGNKPARSLMELTDDKHIFKVLHVGFVWILKACGNRITESLLEGPPTEDSIIDLEKQEETEEGFIKLFSVKESDVEPEKEVKEINESEVNEEEEEEEEDSVCPVIRNIRHLLTVLGDHKFHILAHHAVIGNQIIVKGHNKSTVKSVLNALKSIVPRGCCRIESYSRKYEESWKCNFLGLAPETEIPNHIMSSEIFVLVEINQPKVTMTEMAESLNFSNFHLASPVVLPEKGPAVLTKMEMALKNENLTEEVLEHYLICLKEEWMNKVKVLFKFTKAGGGRSEEDTKRLLQVVGALDEDKQLLKFWMTGLSFQYRTHILSTTKSQK